MRWQYVSPEQLREQLAAHEMEVASIRIALTGVEEGHTVLLGDGPYGPRYTAPTPLANPLTDVARR